MKIIIHKSIKILRTAVQLSTLFYALKYASLPVYVLYNFSVVFLYKMCQHNCISRERTVVSVELGMQSRFGVTFSFIQINITSSVWLNTGLILESRFKKKGMTNVF